MLVRGQPQRMVADRVWPNLDVQGVGVLRLRPLQHLQRLRGAAFDGQAPAAAGPVAETTTLRTGACLEGASHGIIDGDPFLERISSSSLYCLRFFVIERFVLLLML